LITLRFEQLAQMTAGHLNNTAHAQRVFTGVTTDSRQVEPGALFIAIRGERHDGHQFLSEVMARGASGAVASLGSAARLHLPEDFAVVEVSDPHEAMIRLAAGYLDTIPARRIGITGSNGKTTTKEYTFRLLSAVEEHVFRSPGNFNNLFGIPLSIFGMPPETVVAVLEMGISTPGEMARLSAVVRPHLAAVTNVSATHLMQLGSVEAVASEKLSMMRHAAPDAPLVVNADNEVLMKAARQLRRDLVTFGVREKAAFRPAEIRSDGTGSVVRIDRDRFRLVLFGQYQVYNLLAAYAIARTLGYDFKGVDTEGIDLTTSSMRGQTVAARGITFVADCYNANPESVRAGLASFRQLKAQGRRVIVLGDMLELGSKETEYHRAMGTELAGAGFDFAALVGPLSLNAMESATKAGVTSDKIAHFDTSEKCADYLQQFLREGDIVYLKASRGIGLEAVLKRFEGEKR